MKPPTTVALLAALGLALATNASGAATPRRSAETIQVAGKEYVRLSDWAKASGLELRSSRGPGREETLQLSNRSSTLSLAVDSREAKVNGVTVWLLFPVAARNGAAYVSRLDLQTTFAPLLTPPKPQSGARIKTICLDPGHGGKDPGNRVGRQEEKKHTLLLAQEIRDQLTRAGLKVTLTRATDSFVELPERSRLAGRRNADLFVSLHFNSAETARNTVRGAEVYCLTPAGASSTNARGEGGGGGSFAGNRFNAKNIFLAYQVQKALTRSLAVEDRGVRRARFAVLRDAVMPAVLIEAGFMSHPAEGRKIFDPAYRRQMAKAIADALLAYKAAVE